MRGFWHEVGEFLETVILAIVVALIINTFFLQSFYIKEQSMEPTIFPQDRVFVNKLVYHLRSPRTGEVIIFRHTDPQMGTRELIKRVIALPGQTVEIRDGKVYINGELLEEPYVVYHDHDSYGPAVVPPGMLFVMGDNRPVSMDSRYFGFVSMKDLTGRAFVVYWPPSHAKVLGVQAGWLPAFRPATS